MNLSTRLLPLTLFFNFVALFVPSIQALSVDWTADKAPTHTLDHVTAILSGGSGDPSKVDVYLVIRNSNTGAERLISIASNVGNTGRYTVQVPNQYIGDPSSHETVEDYYARDLRWNTRVLNPSNSQSLGQSDEFVIFWSPEDGTATPTKFSDASSSSGGSSSNSGNSGSSSSSGSSDSSGSSNSNNGSGGGSSSSSSKADSTQSSGNANSKSSSSTLVALGAASASASQGASSGSSSTIVVTSTGSPVTVTGAGVSGSTATVTTVVNGELGSSQKGHPNMTGAIVGAVIGGLILAAMLGFLAIWCCRRRRRNRRPTVGRALSTSRSLPQAGIITPAVWNDEEQAAALRAQERANPATHGGQGPNGIIDEKQAMANAYPNTNRLSGATLSGDDRPTEKGVDESVADTNSSYSPVDGYQSSFFAATPGSTVALSSTGGHEGTFTSSGPGSSTVISNSTRASWWTAGQGSTLLPTTPPPEYSRDTTRRSVGTIDGVLANIA